MNLVSPVCRRLRVALLSVTMMLFVLPAGAYANGYPQAGDRMSNVHFTNATLEEVLLFLKKETGYDLLYNSRTVSQVKGISIHKESADVDEIMTESLKGTDLEYTVNEGAIVVRTKTPVVVQQSQPVTIKGRIVTAATKQPLPGAAVFVKGMTSQGTVANGQGEFTLNLPSAPTTPLVFSFLGMQSKEVTYTGQTNLYVELEETAVGMEAVFVSTGYQQVDKREMTSSIFSISGEDVMMSNALTLDHMLQGKIPGLQVVKSNSSPGVSTSIRVRGTSTISGSHEPLWVIDGVIYDDPVNIPAEELNNLDNVNAIGNAISGLNPMDIERIDVLKDASATAIYGVRAANGVIVITTKKGKKGEPRINYSGTFSLTERPSYNKLHRMNSQERIDVSKEIEQRGLTYSYTPAAVGYEGLLYDLYDRKLDYNQFLGKVRDLETMNTDWFDLLYRTAFTHKQNVSVSGANDKMNYYFSGAYTNDKGNVKGTGVEQYNAMAKLQFNVRDNITATLQLSTNITSKDYLYSENKYMDGTNLSLNAYQYAYNTSRTIPAFNEDGSYAYYNGSQGYQQTLERNILNDIDNSGRTVNTSSVNINANVEWKIIDGLRLTGQAALSNSNTEDRSWYGEKSYMATTLRKINYGEELPDDANFREESRLPYGGRLNNSNTRNFNYTVRAQLNYNKYFTGGHSIGVSGGTEARSTEYKGLSTVRWGYLPNRGENFAEIVPSEWPTHYTKGVKAMPDVSTNRLSNFASFYGIATYSYQSRYIFNANIRADGSNKFGQDKSTRFLPIWSVSARWNLHNESFLKNVMWLNQLSFKGSYGVQGNVSDDQTPNMILNINGMEGISKEYYNTLAKLPNPFLKWEKTNSYNLALDFALFDNRLSGTVEYYYKKGKDQIVSVEVSPTVGVSQMSTNVGDVMNRGYEMNLNAIPVQTKDFTWSLNINGSKNTNRVTRGGMTKEYSYSDYMTGKAILQGYSINSFFAYRFDGLDENGYPKFKDIEETEGITKEEMFAQAFAYAGKRIPDMQGGFGTNFRYKNIRLNLFFSYSIGAKVRLNNLYTNGRQYLPNPQDNMSTEFVDRWRQAGDESWAVIPTLSSQGLSMLTGSTTGRTIEIAANRWQMYNQSDLRVVSGDFLRLRMATVQYDIPTDFCKRIGIQAASVRVEGNNLWLIASKKLNGQDPEQLSFGGTGGSTTPPVSSFSLGVNISF